jgi:hypothetical protein
MFVKGFAAALVAAVVIIVGAYLMTVFWPGFGYA